MKCLPKATLIYNPLAGTLNIHRSARAVARFWDEIGWDVQIEPTQYAGHGRILAFKAAAEGSDLVLAAGGDGTLGEIAGGLAGTDTIMAPLPAGTGNSFTKELMLANRGGLFRERTLLVACEKLIHGKVQAIDLGCAQDNKYWLLWTSVGVDSYTVAHIEPRSKLARKFGSVGYLALGTPHLRKFPGMNAKVTIDERVIEGQFLMIVVSNCRRYAGGKFLLNPGAALDDGLFEVWLFKGRSGWSIYRYMMIMGRGRHLNHTDIQMETARDVSIETDPPIPYQRDGDPAGNAPVHCWLEQRALHLLVPDTVSESLFVQPGSPFP